MSEEYLKANLTKEQYEVFVKWVREASNGEEA